MVNNRNLYKLLIGKNVFFTQIYEKAVGFSASACGQCNGSP